MLQDNVETLLSAYRFEASMANAQHGLACWSRACSQIAQGLNAAGMAQFELARSITATFPADLPQGAALGAPEKAARQWLNTTRTLVDTAIRGNRRITDDLATAFFGAADAMVDGMTPPDSKVARSEQDAVSQTSLAQKPVEQQSLEQQPAAVTPGCIETGAGQANGLIAHG